MKSIAKQFLGLSLVTFGALALAVPASAESATVKTDGKASFVPQTGDINVIKPGTDEKITVDGNQERTTVGNVQLMHVPDFDFGNNETSVDTKNYDAIYERYQKTSDATTYAIPHFVQVGDVSGVQGTPWAVTVEQEGLFKEAGGHMLRASRINIYDQTLTNNVHATNVADVVAGLTIPSDASVVIPVAGVDTAGAVSVINSKAGKTDDTTTNGTISSVVFQKNYDEANYGQVSSPAVTDKNSGVKLNVPQSDGVQAKTYSAKLNWTLTVGP